MPPSTRNDIFVIYLALNKDKHRNTVFDSRVKFFMCYRDKGVKALFFRSFTRSGGAILPSYNQHGHTRIVRGDITGFVQCLSWYVSNITALTLNRLESKAAYEPTQAFSCIFEIIKGRTNKYSGIHSEFFFFTLFPIIAHSFKKTMPYNAFMNTRLMDNYTYVSMSFTRENCLQIYNSFRKSV